MKVDHAVTIDVHLGAKSFYHACAKWLIRVRLDIINRFLFLNFFDTILSDDVPLFAENFKLLRIARSHHV